MPGKQSISARLFWGVILSGLLAVLAAIPLVPYFDRRSGWKAVLTAIGGLLGRSISVQPQDRLLVGTVEFCWAVIGAGFWMATAWLAHRRGGPPPVDRA